MGKPKTKKSEKISVSSGTATDIFTDLDVSGQATKRAQHYISVATESLKLKGHPPTVLVLRKDPKTGKTVVVRKAKGNIVVTPKLTAKGTARVVGGKKTAKKKVAKKKTAKKKVARKKVTKKKIAKKKVARKKVTKKKVARRKTGKKRVARRKS